MPYLLDVAQEELLGEGAAPQTAVQRAVRRREDPGHPGSSRCSHRRGHSRYPTREEPAARHASLHTKLQITGSLAAAPPDDAITPAEKPSATGS